MNLLYCSVGCLGPVQLYNYAFHEINVQVSIYFTKVVFIFTNDF